MEKQQPSQDPKLAEKLKEAGKLAEETASEFKTFEKVDSEPESSIEYEDKTITLDGSVPFQINDLNDLPPEILRQILRGGKPSKQRCDSDTKKYTPRAKRKQKRKAQKAARRETRGKYRGR